MNVGNVSKAIGNHQHIYHKWVVIKIWMVYYWFTNITQISRKGHTTNNATPPSGKKSVRAMSKYMGNLSCPAKM